MSSKTVNEDLLIVTQGSKHKADTVKEKDECFLEDKKTIEITRNWIPTADCDDAEATQKTLIRGFRIVHDKSKIGTDHGKKPSRNDNFKGVGGGVHNGQVFFKHADNYPGDHSKNVKVEGNWIVRTGDETRNNKRNCNGKFVEGDGAVTEADLDALLKKACTVEKVATKCKHRDTALDRISVLEGDVVTIVMTHVNDAEVDPAARARPECQVPRLVAEGKAPPKTIKHPCFRILRAAYPATSWRGALEADQYVARGLTVQIGERWIGQGKPSSDSKLAINQDPGPKERKVTTDTYRADPKTGDRGLGQVSASGPAIEGTRMRRDQANAPAASSAQASRGAAEADAASQRDQELRALREQIVEAQRQGMANKLAQLKAREEALEKGREKTQALWKSGAILITSFRALKEVFLAKPVEVKVAALACAGAKPVTIAAYPPGSYGVNLLDLQEFVTAFKALKDVVDKIRNFLKKIQDAGEVEETAGVAVEITAGRFKVAIWLLQDPAAELAVEYRELTRDAVQGEKVGRKKHEVFRAYTIDLKLQKLIGIRFSYSVPVSYATGALGAFAQKLLDKLGADLSFKFEVDLNAGVSGSWEYTEYGKIDWLRKAAITPTVRFTISLNGSAPGASFSIGVTIQWSPTLELDMADDQPFIVRRLPSNVVLKWFVKVAVDIFGWTVDLNYGDDIWKGPIPEAQYALS